MKEREMKMRVTPHVGLSASKISNEKINAHNVSAAEQCAILDNKLWIYLETYDKVVLCWGVHQAADERMLRENREGDTVLGVVAQLSEYMHQVLEASRGKKYY